MFVCGIAFIATGLAVVGVLWLANPHQLHADHELVLSVSDNGVGMLPQGQERKGLVSKVVALLAQHLNGTLVYEYAQPCCRAVLRMQKPKLQWRDSRLANANT